MKGNLKGSPLLTSGSGVAGKREDSFQVTRGCLIVEPCVVKRFLDHWTLGEHAIPFSGGGGWTRLPSVTSPTPQSFDFSPPLSSSGYREGLAL